MQPKDYIFFACSEKSNFKQKMSARVTQNKIKNSSKEYVRNALKILTNYEPIADFVHKITKINCHLCHFAEFIQTQKRCMAGILSKNFSCELNVLETYFLRDVSYLSLGF